MFPPLSTSHFPCSLPSSYLRFPSLLAGFDHIVKHWSQRIWDRYNRAPAPFLSSGVSNCSHPSKIMRKAVIERNQGKCAITNILPFRVAHLYPHCMINGTGDIPNIPPLWDVLDKFWSEERVLSWKRSIFFDPLEPDKQSDSICNQLCVGHTLRIQWNSCRCVFRPLEYGLDRTTLETEWHWQETIEHKPLVNVNTRIPSSRGLDCYTHRDGVLDMPHEHPDPSEGRRRRIRTGDVLTLKTHNATTHPLPRTAGYAICSLTNCPSSSRCHKFRSL